MLNGHLDTNPAGAGWTRDPLGGDVDDAFIYGIGVSNMKAADAAYIAAVRAVRDAGIRLRGDVVLAHVVGELQGGVGTVHMLRQGLRADRFVVGEPTDLALLLLHAGSMELELVTRGQTRHLSKMEEGVDAIEHMLRVIARLRTMTFSGPARADYESVRRLAIGVIRGGLGPEFLDWRPSLLADHCAIRFAVRYSRGQTHDSILADVRRDPSSWSRSRWRPMRTSCGPCVAPTPRSRAPSRSSGAPAPYRYYGTDAAHLSRAVMVGLVYGPGGRYNTMPDERVDLVDLFNAARVYARTIVEVCS